MLGIGPLELLVVLLVGFIFLGPERLVDASKMLGKAARELRRMTDELSQIDLNEDETTADVTPVHRGGGSSPSESATGKDGSSRYEYRDPDASGGADPTSDDGPVSFQPAGEAPAKDYTEPPPPEPPPEKEQA